IGGGYGPGGPGYIGGGYGPGGPGYVVGGPGYVEGCDAYGNCFSRRAWGYGMSSAYRSSTGSSCNAFGCVYW
ncbi:MAG: hypothetical protein KIS78_16875, partial [Labilithrix sp.]|nr:hypothetical protein [Labilithrix sp.]